MAAKDNKEKKEKKKEYEWFVEQIYFENNAKPILTVMTKEEAIKKKYGVSGFHNEHTTHKDFNGWIDIHVSGYDTEEQAIEFKTIVDRG